VRFWRTFVFALKTRAQKSSKKMKKSKKKSVIPQTRGKIRNDTGFYRERANYEAGDYCYCGGRFGVGG